MPYAQPQTREDIDGSGYTFVDKCGAYLLVRDLSRYRVAKYCVYIEEDRFPGPFLVWANLGHRFMRTFKTLFDAETFIGMKCPEGIEKF